MTKKEMQGIKDDIAAMKAQAAAEQKEHEEGEHAMGEAKAKAEEDGDALQIAEEEKGN